MGHWLCLCQSATLVTASDTGGQTMPFLAHLFSFDWFKLQSVPTEFACRPHDLHEWCRQCQQLPPSSVLLCETEAFLLATLFCTCLSLLSCFFMDCPHRGSACSCLSLPVLANELLEFHKHVTKVCMNGISRLSSSW